LSIWANVVDARQRNERNARIRAEETRRSAGCCSLARAGELGREASKMEFLIKSTLILKRKPF
jgi:hypothetical protein